MRWSKFTSASRGTLSRTSVLSVSMLAIINGKVAFLATEIGIVPLSIWPPQMRTRSMPPPPVSGKTPRAPRCTKARDRPRVPAPGLALLFMPDNSGGIVGLGGADRVWAAGAGFRLDLAPLEILPQRRPQAPLLPRLLRALSPLVHGCKITTRGHATEAWRCEWSLEGARLQRARACAMSGRVARIAALAGLCHR